MRRTVAKTYKLYVGGKFPRTESGRSTIVKNKSGDIEAHICQASRKDVRDAVESAVKAASGWTSITAYLRGQILYRMAEMLEGRREEFVSAIKVTSSATSAQARKEVDAGIDCLVRFAGWTDKYAQILGCANPVAGPYYNFTIPQPQGVVGVIAPQSPSLLALIAMIGAPLCTGNTVVVLGSHLHPIPSAILGEVCHTSDVPSGVINILTGTKKELLEHFASHRSIQCLYASDVTKPERTIIEEGASDSLKRVKYLQIRKDAWYDQNQTSSPWNLEHFVEMKTIWHPSSSQ